MKLPNLSTSLTAAPARQIYAGVPAMASGQIQTSGFLDFLKDVGNAVVGKVPCLLSAAGPIGIKCLTTCGPNPACLAACAGPDLVGAIMGCL
ncbi:hypothetical protein [Chitinophaga vietnamensis]|uniref:hypothetical protein n=1 Tax=Chitinophaga vietnamensis TaxID=2593957 RepID=UPI001177A487|nr:hypothetical protein [Chitinophaga vietnamensis]